MKKLLIFGDPNGTASMTALGKYSPENITVWENDSRHVYAIKQVCGRINVTTDLEEIDSTMHFSATIGNPPYLKNLHLEFLLKALQVSDSVKLVHPAGWLFRDGRNIEKQVKRELKGRIKSLRFFNGNSKFIGTEFDCPLVVTHAEKEYNGPIELFYENTGNKYYVNDLSEIPTGFWEPNDTHLQTVETFKKLTESSCIGNIAGKYAGGSFVQSPRTCGHAVTKDPAKFCTNDFFTFFYRNSDITTLKTNEPCYNVSNNEEAESLVSYMKTKFARFAFSIHKISRDCYLGRYLSNVPLPPLDRQWSDDSIMEYYHISPEQVSYINSFIPDYYVQEQAQ